MRVLWLTNFILPEFCEKLGMAPSVKEGWVVGMAAALKAHKSENGIELAIAASVPEGIEQGYICSADDVRLYGFHENKKAHLYEERLETVLFSIAEDYRPDIIHIFGTEFPHTRAMTEGIRKYGNQENGLSTEKILIGIQGVMLECTEHYLDGIPEKEAKKRTLRDVLRSDGMLDQVSKFKLRAVNELEAVKYVGHITGRTPFDEKFAKENAFFAKYHFMNETLRKDYYSGGYDASKANPHEIFVCQGDYPLKGMHFVIQALKLLLPKYPDIKVYVAGDSITREGSFKEKIKLPGYGKYLLKLEKCVEKETGMKCPVEFVGRISVEEMKKRYLSAGLFLCPSTVENSPNSLGEAMLLGVPCVAARVGGIPGIMEDGKEGLLFTGGNVEELAECVDKMFSDEMLRGLLTENARTRALEDHDPDTNYRRLIEIYREISAQ